MSNTENTLKFRNKFVTDGTTKARVHYSVDNHVSGKPTVTIYAQDYSHALGKLLGDDYKNATDLQSDYFDKGHVTLQEGHPHYEAARAAAASAKADDDTRRAKVLARRLNPQPAAPSTVSITSEHTTQYGRYFTVQSGTTKLTIAIALGPVATCRVIVDNAMTRAYRGLGKTFASIEAAKKNYRDPKVLAALVAVERAMKPRIHVKADCVEVVR